MSGGRNGRGVDGNSLASQAALDRAVADAGVGLFRVEHLFDGLWDDGCVIKSVRISCPGSGRGDYLAVVTADVQGVPSVGFNSADTFRECLLGLFNRLENRTLKWKEDQYSNT